MATSLYGDDWKKWPEDLINPNKNTLKKFKEENKEEYSYQLFVQFLFTKQLKLVLQKRKDIKRKM